jgi:glycosyltransferase involved in cell wall biosynthesis
MTPEQNSDSPVEGVAREVGRSQQTVKKPIRILVETLADADLTNAQMVNARDIIRRLNPDGFHVTAFMFHEPDPLIRERPNTRLIQLPERRQTARILTEFLFGSHDVLFYVKASPASKWYMRLRSKRKDKRATVGTVESQCNWRNEPTITKQNVALIESTVLRCDHLFSNSAAVKSSLQREYGLPSEVVPTGVDTEFFCPDPNKQENIRPRVVFVGSLRPFKGPHTVLDAAERFSHIDFAVIGDGPLAGELKARAKGLANIQIRGGISRDEVREEYRRSDICLFPSRWEGSPKVIMEAAACGLPVIARQDYCPETVIQGETGYLVKNDDELFARVAETAAAANSRRRMGLAGRAHMKRFDWTAITRDWENIFLRVAPPAMGGGS